MSIFSKKKVCSCLEGSDAESSSRDAAVKILGSGCEKCNKLEENTHKALKQLFMNTDIDHVRDFAEIGKYGVMTTPAIVYNGKVLCSGKVLKTEEIISLLQREM